MTTSKDKVAASIDKARANLEQALTDLEHLPAFDPRDNVFAAHALNNFLAVIRGTVELLLLSLKDYPETQVRIWLEGLQHAADLMMHTVNQLMNTSASADPLLIFRQVNLPLLVQRACNYYDRVAVRKRIRIVFTAVEAPPVWTDPVAAAAVMDNLLSNAVKYSPLGKRVLVSLTSEPAAVVCSVQDEGPGISPQDQSRLTTIRIRHSNCEYQYLGVDPGRNLFAELLRPAGTGKNASPDCPLP